MFLILYQIISNKTDAQQWLGQNNSDSILSTPRYTGNNVHIAKHLIVRMAATGDMADFVNEHSNLEHGSDLIWAVLLGPRPK